MPRIVSLIPSATEIVSALGLGGELVGRSHECDYPAAVRALPVLTAPRLDVARSSAAIDDQVKALLDQAQPVYELDAERLRTLRPEVIVTQSHCAVCGVDRAGVERALEGWIGPPVRIVALEPGGLGGVWRDIGRVAEALGAASAGRNLVASLRARVAAIERRAGQLATRPRVAAIEWLDPLMLAGNWVPALVRSAGGVEPLGEAGSRSPYVDWQTLAETDPEVVIAFPCGFDIARTRREFAALAGRPGWHRLSAVRHGRVFLADGNQYFNRPGPRLVESLEILAEILHPETFAFGHRGAGWVASGE